MKNDTNKKLFLPFYGSFIIHDNGNVEWQPNVNLTKTPSEQFKVNKTNKHFDNKKLIGKYI